MSSRGMKKVMQKCLVFIFVLFASTAFQSSYSGSMKNSVTEKVLKKILPYDLARYEK